MTSPLSSPRPIRAFSLVEMLVVLAIIAIVSALVVPAVNGIGGAFTMTTTGQTVLDQLVSARQLALSRNRNAEVRFYKSAPEIGTGDIFRGTQIWVQAQKDGVVSYQPTGRVQWIKNGFKILESETYSPLIGNDFEEGYGGTTDLPKGKSTSLYVAVRFRANGAPDAPLTPANNFLTLAGERESGDTVPANHYTVQIHPLTGRATVYRP